MPCGMENSLLLKPATIFLDGEDQMIGIMVWHAWVLFGRTLDSFMMAVAQVIRCTSHLRLVRKRKWIRCSTAISVLRQYGNLVRIAALELESDPATPTRGDW